MEQAQAHPQDREDHVDLLLSQWARELPDLDTEPMALFSRAWRVLSMARPVIGGTFARFGLDSGEFDVLATLRRAGPPYRLTPTELYKSLMITSGGLTARLRRLEQAGLVERERSDADGRSLPVALTEAGLQVVEAAVRAHMATERALLADLDPADLKQLIVLLRRLGHALVPHVPSAEE